MIAPDIELRRSKIKGPGAGDYRNSREITCAV